MEVAVDEAVMLRVRVGANMTHERMKEEEKTLREN
jgi:hypothetical protein